MSVLGRVLQVALGVGLLVVAAVSLVRPLNSWFVFVPAVVLPATLATVLWLVVAQRRAADGVVAGRVWPGTVAGTVLAAVHLPLALVDFGWDARQVLSSAKVLAAGGQLSVEAVGYFARYPNNLTLLALEQGAGRAGDLVGLPPAAAVLTAHLLCVPVVLWALGRSAVELGRPAAVLPVQVLATLLLALSPAVAVPYTDLPAAASVSVVALAGVRCHRRWSWGWALTGLLALSVGILLKPYVAVLAVALVLVALGSGRARPVALVAAGVVLLLLTTTAAAELTHRQTGLSPARLAEVEAPFPPEHFLAMGTWDSGEDSPVRRWGGYRQDQVDATAALPEAERARELRAQVRGQVLERGTLGNLAFFGSKTVWVWGDGTFWAHGEGGDRAAPAQLSGRWSVLTAWTHGAGEHYPLRASLVQGVWLGLLLVTGRRLLRARPDPLLTWWCLALGGLTAYLLLFEARPRYLWALLPLVLLTWAGTLRSQRTVGNTPSPSAQKAVAAGRGKVASGHGTYG